MLLKHGAKINAVGKNGAGALHQAAIFSDVGMIEFLIDKGISVNFVDNDDETPLLWACQSKDNVDNVKHGSDIKKINKEDGGGVLHNAAKYSDKSLIELLLIRGISVNEVDKDGETPLLWACQAADNIENVTVLMQHGADINAFNKVNGAGVLHSVAKCSDKSTVEFLLKEGVSVNIADNDDETPLLWACRSKKNC